MSKKFTKGQLLDLLSDKLAHQMSKMALAQIKEGLEKRLESLNMWDDDALDAANAARQDIEGEYGAEEFPEFGSMEDPKAFARGVGSAKEKNVDAHASAWKDHYSSFNEKVTSYITSDPKLAEYSAANPHEFLDAMAVAMYKYMMDHNRATPFISSVQQWIIDLNDQFDPTDEETGEVQMDPVSHRIYGLLSKFEKDYNRSVLATKAAGLREERADLGWTLSLLEEAWDWSYGPETHGTIRDNIFLLPHDELVEILVEWIAYEAAGRNSSVMAADFDIVNKDQISRMPHDVLAQRVAEKAEQFRTADNGGHHAWACPYGCHKVSVSPEEVVNEDLDDFDLDGGDLSDDPQSVESAMRVDDVSHGYYVVPPVGDDPLWYVVDSDGDPVEGYETEELANAALPELEAQSRGLDQMPDGYGTDFKEGRLDRMERLLNEVQDIMRELGNYPVGADTMEAPWNTPEVKPAKRKPKSAYVLVDSDEECLVVHHGGEYYAMNLDSLTTEDVRSIAIDFVGVPEVEPGFHDASEYNSAKQLPAEAIVDYLNDNIAHLKMGEGIQAWEAGVSDLVRIDHDLARLLKAEYPRLSVPIA